MEISTFIDQLRTYKTPLVFNPWKDYDKELDVNEDAPVIRSANLRRYLELRKQARYLFIAEALGYQGGHFSGIAMTSERIILGNHPDVEPKSVLGDWAYQRTSNPESPLLNNTQKRLGFNEPTATVVWNALIQNNLAANDVILWNIFPFHPYKKKNELLTNRTPSIPELDEGIKYVKMLLNLVPEMQIVAIGQKSATTLGRYGVGYKIALPHPSMGGANDFRSAMKKYL